MNGIGLLLLFSLIRTYYRIKWEGRHAGEPLDLKWIKRRIDCKALEKSGQILSCHYEKSRREHFFLVQNENVLEWHIARHTLAHGWVMD